MDDKNLKTQFDGYFEGAKLPVGITADAKAHVKAPKREGLKWFFRLAPAFAAAVVIMVGAVIMVRSLNFNVGQDEPQYSYYSADGLTSENIDPYSINSGGLLFLNELAHDSAANVSSVTAFSADGNMKFARAEISMLHKGFRHDTVIYAEFTEEYECLDELEGFLEGESRFYQNSNYIFNTDYDEGENVYKIYMQYGGIKYYISVTTSEPNGYTVYLNLIKNAY